MMRVFLILAIGMLGLTGVSAGGDVELFNPMPVWDGSELAEAADGTYSIGNIRIDKANHNFTVAAKVLRTEPPLEYFAVTRGGHKAYESLLEFWASAFQVNLASILIGLEADDAPRPGFQFDPTLLDGKPVDILVSWDDGGDIRHVNGLASLLVTEKPADTGQWVYTGSFKMGAGGPLAAEKTGSLIGLVHDPASLFEHNEGLGIGAYGSVGGNTEVLPAVGEWVYVTISLAERSEGDQEAQR